MSRMVQALQVVAWRESRRQSARAQAKRTTAPDSPRSARKWRIDPPPTIVALPNSPVASVPSPYGVAFRTEAASPAGPSDPFLGLSFAPPEAKAAPPVESSTQPATRIDATGIDLPCEAMVEAFDGEDEDVVLLDEDPEEGEPSVLEPDDCGATAGCVEIVLPLVQSLNSMMALALESLPAPAIGPPLVATPPFPLLPEIEDEASSAADEEVLEPQLEKIEAAIAAIVEPLAEVEAIEAVAAPVAAAVEPEPTLVAPLPQVELVAPVAVAVEPEPVREKPGICTPQATPLARVQNAGLLPAPQRTQPLDIRFHQITARQSRASAGSVRMNLAIVEQPLAGQLQELAQNLNAALATGGPAAILLASPDADGQVAEVLAQVARVLAADESEPTLIVDCNLGSQSLTRRLGLSDAPGLGEILAGDDAPALACLTTEIPHLSLLPHGAGLAEASPEAWSAALGQLRQRYRRILVDVGPLAATHTAALARACDATFLLVRLGITDAAAAAQAVDQLRTDGGRVLGCIVTNAPA